MKHILAPILLLVFLFPSLAMSEEVTMDDLVERDGITYKKFSNVPFSGKVTGIQEGSFKKGNKEGPWFYYWSNGQVFVKAFYRNGSRNGPGVIYYQNGQMHSEGNYLNGLQEGRWEEYWDTGDLLSRGKYRDGFKDGLWIYYLVDGTVMEDRTGTYKNGEKVD